MIKSLDVEDSAGRLREESHAWSLAGSISSL